MDAREYFENARAAQRRIDGCMARIEAMRSREGVRAQRYERTGGGGGARDAMGLTAARIDAEARMAGEVEALSATVADAREVCAGVRAANPCRFVRGDVLELRYCDDLGWHQIASALGISESHAKATAAAALDWVDQVGIARAREGMGRATLF